MTDRACERDPVIQNITTEMAMSDTATINIDETAEDNRTRTLRVEVQATIEREGISVRNVAEQSGVGYSSLAAWMNGTYAGRNDKVNDKVKSWLDAQRSRERVRQSVAKAPGFLELPTAQTFLTVFEYAQATPDIGLITGGAGIGKTQAAIEYQRRTPNVWVMTADPSMQSPSAVLRELCDVMEVQTSAQRRLGGIIRRVRGTEGLIIVDEAQHLQTPAIDEMRTIHDRAQIGLVFMGNEPLRRRIEGMGREASHAMIFSRVGMRKKRDRPQVKDVAMLLDAWGVEDKAIRDLCRWIALQPGGLRQMNKTMTYARMLGHAAGRESVDVRDINSAWKELTSGELPARV